MKFGMKPICGSKPTAKRRLAAFTFAEVLAALVFMAIVIPVAIEGIQLSNRAGEVARRKATAAQLADSLMTELIATEQWKTATQSGNFGEEQPGYEWRTWNEGWNFDAMRVFWIEVRFHVQGREYAVRLGTLVEEET